MPSVKSNAVMLLLSSLLLLAVGLYWEATGALFVYWLDDDNYTYSHGLLLFLVSLYLIYERWRALSQPLVLNPSWVGGVVVFISSLAWLAATIGSIQIVQFLSLVGVVSGIFWGVMGFSQARLFALPILLILGALPLWDPLATMLQLPTTLVTEWMLRLTMIPVLREGFFLFIPAGTFEIEAACSGLRYILVAVLLALIFGALHGLRWWVTASIVLAAAAIGIIANLIRIYTVILIGQYTNMQSDLVEDHASIGWVLFAIGAVPLFWFASKHAAQEKYVARIEIASITRRGRVNQSVGVVSLLVGLLVGPLWMGYVDRQAGNAAVDEGALPAIIEEAVKDDTPIDYRPTFISGDVVKEGWVRSEKKGGASVYLYFSRFYSQTQDKEAVSSANRLVTNSSSWHQIETGVNSLQGSVESTVNSATLSSGDTQLRVWQWYQIGDRRIASPLWAKIYNVVETLQGSRIIDVVVLATEVDDDVATADALLYRFSEQF